MEQNSKYRDLDVWKKGISLVKYVYKITQYFPKEETYGLMNQIRRCAVSIPSNIAEGCGRHRVNDSLNFFYISRGSLYELDTQLLIAFELQYIDQETYDNAIVLITDCKKLTNGFINYFKTLKD